MLAAVQGLLRLCWSARVRVAASLGACRRRPRASTAAARSAAARTSSLPPAPAPTLPRTVPAPRRDPAPPVQSKIAETKDLMKKKAQEIEKGRMDAMRGGPGAGRWLAARFAGGAQHSMAAAAGHWRTM